MTPPRGSLLHNRDRCGAAAEQGGRGFGFEFAQVSVYPVQDPFDLRQAARGASIKSNYVLSMLDHKV